MGYFLEKLHTALDIAANPSFLRHYRPGIIPTTFCRLNVPWLKAYDFRTILDIGANVGRFSVTAHAVFPKANIFAFEPLPSCFAAVQRAAATIGPVKPYNVALGDVEGAVEMFANDFSPSSSMLPMAQSHKDAFPFTQYGQTVSVQTRRLDDMAADIEIVGPMFVKIDVQGFERQVLAGGRETIGRSDVVLLELSFEELYEGQPLFDDIFDEMRGLGFRFRGTMAQMPHPHDGRILDADCFFIRVSG